MEIMNFTDLLKRNDDAERKVQKERKSNKETLQEIAEAKVEKYGIMYNDFIQIGQFVERLGTGADFQISMKDADTVINIKGTDYVFSYIRFYMSRGIGLTKISFNFIRKGSSHDAKEIILEDAKHYSGTSLSTDSMLTDNILFKWDSLRPYVNDYVRAFGENVIKGKLEKVHEESSELYDANKEWIEALKEKSAVA